MWVGTEGTPWKLLCREGIGRKALGGCARERSHGKEGSFQGRQFVSAPAPACTAGMGLLLCSLTVPGWVFQKAKGGVSPSDSIMSCKSLYLMSVTFSLIPHSPNYLYAFFSLTKDESKRPKYKELLVSSQCCIFQCLQHTTHRGWAQAEVRSGAEPWSWAAAGPVFGGCQRRQQQCFGLGSVTCANFKELWAPGGHLLEAVVPQSALGFTSPDVKGIFLMSWLRTSLMFWPSCSDLALASAACWAEQRVGAQESRAWL